MLQWMADALIQIMICRLFGTKPLSNTNLVKINWPLRNKLNWNFNQNSNISIHKDASKTIVCEMVAILSRGDELNHNTCLCLVRSYFQNVIMSNTNVCVVLSGLCHFYQWCERTEIELKLYQLAVIPLICLTCFYKSQYCLKDAYMVSLIELLTNTGHTRNPLTSDTTEILILHVTHKWS